MGGFPYLIFSKGDKVSAAASVGDERSPLATIAPLCIPPQGEDLTCRFGRRRTLSTGELRPLATPLRGGAPPPSHPPGVGNERRIIYLVWCLGILKGTPSVIAAR